MANLITNQGLQRIGILASQAVGYSSSRYIRTMAVDDSVTPFGVGSTSLLSPSNMYDKAFDATPTVSGSIITHVMTIPVGSGNFTIRRISLHDDTIANVTGSSTTLISGIDGQSLTKTSDFSLEITVTYEYQ